MTSLVEMSPGGKQQIHQHVTEQSYFIITGEGEMTVGNEKITVQSGDSIYIPSNAPHGLINNGKEILVYLSAGSPPFGKEIERQLWPLAPTRMK
jgi:mannose-6-phosphate isomerase-like protein (cupin superfamily)